MLDVQILNLKLYESCPLGTTRAAEGSIRSQSRIHILAYGESLSGLSSNLGESAIFRFKSILAQSIARSYGLQKSP